MGARGPKPIPLEQRARKFIVVDERGCHLWTGALDRKGYAKAGRGGFKGGTVDSGAVVNGDTRCGDPDLLARFDKLGSGQ